MTLRTAFLPVAAAFVVALLPGQDSRPTSRPPSDEIELTATWGRIAHSSHRRHEQDELRDVLQPGPAQRRRSYAYEDFLPLVPDSEAAEDAAFEIPFDAIRPFLDQIHPGARGESHMGFGGYSGIHGILLERGVDRVDLLIRAHVEFELKPGEIFFTVSQLEGRLILDPRARRVLGFRLAVPSRSYNYDVHIRQGRRMLIDIGYVPDLGVAGGFLPQGTTQDTKLAAARKKLLQAFYPFERLDWMSLAEALRASRQQGKPLHLVTIFGQLDDESC